MLFLWYKITISWTSCHYISNVWWDYFQIKKWWNLYINLDGNLFQKENEVVTLKVVSSIKKAIKFFSIKTEMNPTEIKFDKNTNNLFMGKESEFIQTNQNIR
jgi:hypothetical protein